MTQDADSLSGVAGRYASALYALASEKGATDEVAAALANFQSLINDSPDLARLVKSPVYSSDEQVRAIGAVMDKAGIAGVAANFIRLVASKRRLFVLSDMIDAFQRLNDRAKGLVRADVTVAAPLRPDQETTLRQTLSGVTGGKSVSLNVRTDPSIVDGVIVKLGSRMVDASVRTKLNAIRTRMKEVG